MNVSTFKKTKNILVALGIGAVLSFGSVGVASAHSWGGGWGWGGGWNNWGWNNSCFTWVWNGWGWSSVPCYSNWGGGWGWGW